MADEALLKQLSVETRARLRSTQILTSLPTIISELLQNAIDAGASQIDIGVDCAEWSCWVVDNGSGFTKDGLHRIGLNPEHGRYGSSKAYNPASLETISTFGFRGEALASMADLSCLEISSRTARSRESWSIVAKAGKSLYVGPSIRWRREAAGTVVSIRDAFFNLPVRRQCHPSPSKTIDLIRQELEAYALVFPNISFSFQDATKTRGSQHSHKSHILKVPKSRSTLAVFRHFYGRAFTECVEEITVTSGQLQIEGFISLVGAYTKSYQFLYINRHPISYCDLHRLIDNRFAASTFAKHAYDEGGETSLRPRARRSPRKGEKKPVYVLNLVIPVKHIDNCLEPSKSTVELDNKNSVNSFLSATIQSFLVHHSFAPDKRGNEDSDDGHLKKKKKLIPDCSAALKIPSGSVQSERSGIPKASVHVVRVADVAQETAAWKDPSTGETFIIDNHTGNSRPQCSPFTPGTDGAIGAVSKRRTLRTRQLTAEELDLNKINADGDHVPEWLQEALQVNNAFALKEPRIPSLSLLVHQDSHHRDSHSYPTGCPAKHAISDWNLQLGPSNLAASQLRFRKDDLRKVQIISQVDRKFIACVIGPEHDDSPGRGGDNGSREAELPVDGKTLVLIDQHAADERVRVERLLKSICRGFLSHQEGSGSVETRQLSPPVPVLLTRHEASRLAELPGFQKAFQAWGFGFSGLEEVRSRSDGETELGGGYTQVFVSAIPEIVSEKLLLGNEMQELVKGYIGALESRDVEPLSQLDFGSTDEETQWLKALRWCPRELLDLINSKACRSAIMFNDPLNTEQCERLVRQLAATVFPFQCAHGRPSLVPLTRLITKSERHQETGLKWEKVAAL